MRGKKKLESEESLKQQKTRSRRAVETAETRSNREIKSPQGSQNRAPKNGSFPVDPDRNCSGRDVAWAMVRDESGRGFVLKKGPTSEQTVAWCRK